MWVLLAVLCAGGLFAVTRSFAEAGRRKELDRSTRAAGLEMAVEDPMPRWSATRFELFRLGDGRGSEFVVWDPADPNGVRVFDFWWYDENDDDQRRYQTVTCALAEVGWMWPELTVTRENLFSRLATAAGLPEIELESADFTRTYEVRCSDARFATAFLDPQMIERIGASQGRFQVYVRDRWLLVVTSRLDGQAVVPFFRWATALRASIPRVVFDLYPVPAAQPW